MRTSQATDVRRRPNGADATGLPVRSSETAHCTSGPRRLEQALAEVESLKRELASARQRTGAREPHAERLLKTTAQHGANGDRRAYEDASALPWCSPWHTTDATCLDGSGCVVAPAWNRILWAKSRIPKAHVLYRAGDKLDALYAVRFGSCKTVLLSKSGHDQVVDFSIVGDVVGTDGFASEVHTCQAIALEDTEVYRLPLESIEHFARRDPSFGHDFHKLLSQELVRAHTLMLVLGSMRAEQRVAFFLLDLSQRYQSRGFSSSEYVLRMSRQEIGSYLGLKLETVSRVFSRFQREGLLEIEGRSIVLRDRAALTQRADGG